MSMFDDIGSAIGLGAGASQAFGQVGQGPPIYQPTGLGGADQQFQQLLAALGGEMGGIAGHLDPVLLQSFMQMMGIDPSGLSRAGAAAGQQYGGLAGQAGQFGQQLGAQGTDIYNLSRDPMNQLHDYLQSQTVEGSRAGTSARGLGMSPYAAGLENDATRKFNMDWQSQLLDRALAGTRASGQDFAGSLALGSMQPAFTMQGAQAPIAGQAAAAQFPGAAAMQYGQNVQQGLMSPQMAMQNQILPYLGYGTEAGRAGFNAFDMNRQFGAGQRSAGLESMLTGLGGLGGSSMMDPGGWLMGLFGGGGAAGGGATSGMEGLMGSFGEAIPGMAAAVMAA